MHSRKFTTAAPQTTAQRIHALALTQIFVKNCVVGKSSRLLPLWLGGFIVSFALPLVTTVITGAKSMDKLRDNIDSTRVQLDVADGRQSTASMNQMAPRRSK
jgi:uncharacterized membrane protein (DUF106 family)